MPLACLFGRGDKRLLNIGLARAQLMPEHTVVIGVRSSEPEELNFLQARGVRMIDSEEIARRGFAGVPEWEAIGIVRAALMVLG